MSETSKGKPAKTLGQTIREGRYELGEQRRAFAKRIGVTAGTIKRWEDDQSRPQSHSVVPLARALRATPAELGYPEITLPDERPADPAPVVTVKEAVRDADEDAAPALVEVLEDLIAAVHRNTVATMQLIQTMDVRRAAVQAAQHRAGASLPGAEGFGSLHSEPRRRGASERLPG